MLVLSLIGNPVKFGDGPAAVIGDESRICHCSVCRTGLVKMGYFAQASGWEGAVSRTIRESEDLPE